MVHLRFFIGGTFPKVFLKQIESCDSRWIRQHRVRGDFQGVLATHNAQVLLEHLIVYQPLGRGLPLSSGRWIDHASRRLPLKLLAHLFGDVASYDVLVGLIFARLVYSIENLLSWRNDEVGLSAAYRVLCQIKSGVVRLRVPITTLINVKCRTRGLKIRPIVS